MAISNSRKNNFNIIRFVAAMMVILGHMCHLMGVNVCLFLGQAVSTIGVKIFFLISGYLIAKSFLNDSNILRYSIRRIFRIIPGLIGVVCFAVFIVGPMFTTLPLKGYFLHGTTRAYFKNIFLYIQYFLPGVFENNIYPNAVNGSLWTLPVEMFMYILLPLVFLVFKRCDKAKVSLIIAVLLEAFSICLGKFKPGAFYVVYATDVVSALTIAPYFFLGAAFISERVRKYLNIQMATGLICILAMLNLSEFVTEIALFVVLPYFIFSFAFVENPKFEKCFSKNDLSYGLYLYGFIIQQILTPKLTAFGFGLNLQFVICAAVTLCFAALSWFVIEKPAQKFSKYLLAKTQRE